MILFSRNAIEKDSWITASGRASYLIDRNRWTVWEGSSSDTTTDEIKIDLQKTKKVKRIALTGTNLKKVQIEADTYGVIAETTTNTQDYINFDGLLQENVRNITVKAYTTITANQTKRIAELLIVEKYFEIENPETFDPAGREQAGDLHLADGTARQWKIPYSERWGGRFEFSLNWSTITQLRDFKSNVVRHPFTVQPFPTENPAEYYLCHWINPYEVEYLNMWNSAGERLYKIDMELKEV